MGQEAELVAAYTAGATVEELAARHGCSVTTVRDVLEAEGVERRPRGPRSPREGREHEVAAAYEAGVAMRRPGRKPT